MKNASCRHTEPAQGGTYEARICDFCYEDSDCSRRLGDLATACVNAKVTASRAVMEQEHPEVQNELKREWEQAYRDWTAAYQHHRDCPDRRYRSPLYQSLIRANVIRDGHYIPDDQRLGVNPATG